MASDHIVILSDGNFESEVMKSSLPVVVDFWAPWCNPCKNLAPVLDQIADEKKGQVKIGKVNVDDNPGLASRYGIRSIPTLLFFKNGQLKDQSVGLVSKKDLEARISALV